ncbi:HAD superfamily hydrolase (TIGR01509 family) [Terracoccus luteus]|uniref:HAD superfamily hydrolase (TIGR01509 family) n=1 Tax=Terracoccus luteus TaxID=53356 RepID=A0A495XV05_9MICO|nr:HAD superfamily hydrolase (TIGR01509 family) [Terracoccus luteus]MCP2173320.1 HAD superfamily hydrolase (TIGR01509 family) [Terracoccus luteus]RKT78057.1 HAD superfamily hydrolase (TIGR01509 family) [Terracoccus luteus]
MTSDTEPHVRPAPLTRTDGDADAGLPAAVLWDMDGTLVDTEPYWIQAEHELVAEHGGQWSDEFAHELVGNALEVSAQLIIDKSHIPLTVPEIIDGLLGRVVAQVRREVPWRPGARELLLELDGLGVPNLLVTMSWRSLADVVVGGLPDGTFRALVTGDEVAHGKPHPEPYLAAARLVGVDPADCVALEDSPTGVRSATAAGVPTIAIPHVVPVPDIEGAVRVTGLDGVRAHDLLTIVASVRRGA